jgi:hypothetical protein
MHDDEHVLHRIFELTVGDPQTVHEPPNERKIVPVDLGQCRRPWQVGLARVNARNGQDGPGVA